MARQTRDERRKRRAQAEASNDRAPRQPREAARPVSEAAVHAPEARRGNFLAESYAELRKVDWPTRNQTFQGVVVVIIACVIVGAYLWGLDQVIRPLVDKVLL